MKEIKIFVMFNEFRSERLEKLIYILYTKNNYI